MILECNPYKEFDIIYFNFKTESDLVSHKQFLEEFKFHGIQGGLSSLENKSHGSIN